MVVVGVCVRMFLEVMRVQMAMMLVRCSHTPIAIIVPAASSCQVIGSFCSRTANAARKTGRSRNTRRSRRTEMAQRHDEQHEADAYPTKPSAAACRAGHGWQGATTSSAKPIFVAAGGSPLNAAMTNASLVDTLRVRLLSRAQQRHATRSAAARRERRVAGATPASARLSRWQHPQRDASIEVLAKQEPRDSAVNTASRLRRSDAVDAVVATSPYSSATGAATPPSNVERPATATRRDGAS